MASQPTSTQSPSARLQEILSERIQELSESEEVEDMGPEPAESVASQLAKLQLVQSPLKDELVTESSEMQDQTLEDILPFLTENPYEFDLNSHGIPKLQRSKHISFLHHALGSYPARMVVMDAARPWILYWSLQGLTCLGEDVSKYQDRVTYTFAPCQNPTGGFGGGHGQLSHLAASYAAVLSLTIVGGEEAYEMIDRKAMWHWLGEMKQQDGGFTLAAEGEEDIRGAFCAMVIIALLNLPLELPPGSPARIKGDETFLTNLPEWIARCQTYEGGMAASPGNEAHGAYAFCGLGCLCIMGAPYDTMAKYLDIPALLACLTSRQTSPEGGFAGRVNKLVDGCYSHWVGGCWALLEAAILGPRKGSDQLPKERLWDREALGRYILCCCQGQRGGLRDKPGKPADAYHTCYNLAGLSAVQHRYVYASDKESGFEASPLSAAFKWAVADEVQTEDGNGVWDEGDEVELIHPIFAVPWGKAEAIRGHFEKKVGF